MANIDRHLLANRLDRVPPEIRSMKRLWVGKGLNGLLTRRDAEAALFQRGV
jgi:GH24 family phage-related lysozyme (muramidase)